jgi:hypothetical protein
VWQWRESQEVLQMSGQPITEPTIEEMRAAWELMQQQTAPHVQTGAANPEPVTYKQVQSAFERAVPQSGAGDFGGWSVGQPVAYTFGGGYDLRDTLVFPAVITRLRYRGMEPSQYLVADLDVQVPRLMTDADEEGAEDNLWLSDGRMERPKSDFRLTIRRFESVRPKDPTTVYRETSVQLDSELAAVSEGRQKTIGKWVAVDRVEVPNLRRLHTESLAGFFDPRRWHYRLRLIREARQNPRAPQITRPAVDRSEAFTDFTTGFARYYTEQFERRGYWDEVRLEAVAREAGR